MKQTFYRYEAVEYAAIGIDGDYEPSKFPSPKVEIREFTVLGETAKGYWISHGSQYGISSPKKWVSKTSKKRYAYPTKQEALQGFIKRNERRIKILSRQLDACKISISIARNMVV